MRSSVWRTTGCVALLAAVNASICRELFWTEYTRHLHSIEAAYVAISRYVIENWRDLSWFPLWYTGVSFQNSYPPLLHLVVAFVAAAGGISPALAHHAVTTALYCLGSVTLFWLALRLGADRLTALASGLAFSLLSPSGLLIPAVAADMGSPWYARRLHALVYYGEGPHVSSLALLPVAVVLAACALEKRRPGWYLAAALSLAAVVLTNWLGAVALAAGMFAWLLASRADRRTWLRAAGLAIYAYLAASPWIPPSTLAAVRMNAQRVGGDYRMGLRQLVCWLLALAVLVLVSKALNRARVSQMAHFAVLFTLITGALALTAYWTDIALLPQPHRYHLEMELGIALLAAAGLRRLLAAPRRTLAIALSGMLVVLGAIQFRNYRRFARHLIQPVDMSSTLEYRLANWFKQNLGERRVMAPGSVSFWMNAFTDTPQLGGGFEQGITNPWIPAAIFQIYSGMNAGRRESEVAVLWLKTLGVHAVAVGGVASREAFKPFANPAKFHGVLPEVWREADDAVYAVPQRTSSLARVVRRRDLLRQPLATAVDVDPLRPFVAALEDPALPEARWRWRNRHEAEITAELRREHALSIAVSYHPGWKARVNGARRPVSADGLGLMVIEPDCEGPCRIELTYTGGLEMLLARLASLGALGGGLIWMAVSRRRPKA